MSRRAALTLCVLSDNHVLDELPAGTVPVLHAYRRVDTATTAAAAPTFINGLRSAPAQLAATSRQDPKYLDLNHYK
jgi:hypothetical protein